MLEDWRHEADLIELHFNWKVSQQRSNYNSVFQEFLCLLGRGELPLFLLAC